MKCILKALLLPLLLHTIYFILPGGAFAAGEFTTDYDVTYEVQPAGESLVTQKVTLTNQTNQYYASEYTLALGSRKVSGVEASDGGGPISPKVNDDKIRLVFNEQTAGIGSRLKFTLKYKDEEVSQKRGRILEVLIPKTANQSEINAYNVILKVPESFGQPFYISPAPRGPILNKTGSYWQYQFSKEQISSFGVRAAFGDYQAFDLSLVYHLKNPNLGTAATEIALPPDIRGVQKTIVKKLNPPPTEVKIDADENYLAQYQLSGGEEKTVTFEGRVLVFYPPLNPASDPGAEYTKPQKFWEADDSKIKEAVEGNSSARQVYEYVTKTLKYDSSRIEEGLTRRGAVAALEDANHAVCIDFADLLITLLRTVGIPARSLEGYAYTENETLRPTDSDVLHAWVQYYSDKLGGWVSIDPTWGSTTGGQDYFTEFDTNHIVFAAKGLNSGYPYPAGSYKLSPDQSGDVKVGFAGIDDTSLNSSTPQLLASFDISTPRVGGLPFSGQITVRNAGATTAFGVKANLSSSEFGILGEKVVDIGTLPPYTGKTFPVKLKLADWKRGVLGSLEIGLEFEDFDGAGKTIIQTSPNLKVDPFFRSGAMVYVILTLIILLTFIKTSLFLVKKFV